MMLWQHITGMDCVLFLVLQHVICIVCVLCNGMSAFHKNGVLTMCCFGRILYVICVCLVVV